jgi:histidinol-phosphate/aromatic aminotransferase/cobyric acid decarboxylase-like protein/imidazoleglycerol phosphate dehydratase HisB
VSDSAGGRVVAGGFTPGDPGVPAGPRAVPLPDGFASYTWASTVADVAARHGLRVEQVLKFDQNTPPLPGVPQIPLAESFARLSEYPDGLYRDLREAAAVYVGASTTWDQVVVGAGADDLILLCARTFLGPGLRAAVAAPTYALYRIATQLAGAQPTDELDGAALIWRCNPNNPTGETKPAADLAALARSRPDAVVVVDEAYVEFGADSAVPYVAETPNLIVLRTLSKAFGFAALRVGYAVAAPQTAALLEERRAPAPIAAPAARIAAAALRSPRFDVESTLAERERVRSSLVAAGWDDVVAAGNFVWLPTEEPLGERLEAEGLIVRRFPQGIRITIRRPTENNVLLRALGAEPGPAPGRSATVIRTTTETALRITLDLDGNGRSRVETGIGFLDHLLTLMSFHAGFDLDCVAGGDLDVDEHHTVEDVLASLGSAVAQALGAREGVARYGSAVVPMDEARAIAAVDLVRRPHAEIELIFTGDRVGGLALSLLPHALERLTMEAGCTVHVEASGKDDHHVAEAAFKALGQALRHAVAPGGEGIRSTKGSA